MKYFKRLDSEGNLICPWCGGKVKLMVCDIAGQLCPQIKVDDAENYRDRFFFVLSHEECDVPMERTCPIATIDGAQDVRRALGAEIYDSREEAYKAWLS